MSSACEMAGVLEDEPTASLNRSSETPSPEQELVRQLQAGNGGAYSGFVERYAAAIFRVAHGILGNRCEAEEITQQVFVKIFLSIASFGGRSSLYSWVYRITVNECYSALRKRRFTISLDAENDDGKRLASLVVDRKGRATLSFDQPMGDAQRRKLTKMIDTFVGSKA